VRALPAARRSPSLTHLLVRGNAALVHPTINNHTMADIEIGRGDPLLLIHESLCDFRVWSPIIGPLSVHHRPIAPSPRRCIPER
jgi:hypothetical protein